MLSKLRKGVSFAALLILITIITVLNGSAGQADINAADISGKVEIYSSDNILSESSSSADYSVESVPFSYSSVDKGYVTPAKDQRYDGPCWAFSSISMAETSIIKNGISVNGALATASSIDLSESHLIYFLYNNALDPLGNLAGDSAKLDESVSPYEVGGNNFHALLALAAWRGVANESIAPYPDSVDEVSFDDSIAWTDVAHMQNAYVIPMSEKEAIKKQIMENGCVISAYNHYDECYNPDTCAYYNPEELLEINHSITIVGWDDNYSVRNFAGLFPPSEDGAWLVKNSWGEDFGNNGYFWMSYEDFSLQHENAYVYIFERGDNYDYNYQYDGTDALAVLGLPSAKRGGYDNVYYSNVFTVSGSEKQYLEAVSFAMQSTDVNYKIQIYKNPHYIGSGANKVLSPVSGTALLSEPVSGTTSYSGYYTVPLGQNILLTEGDRFAIVLFVDNTDNALIYVDCDSQEEWVTFTNAVHPEESFLGVAYSIGGGKFAYSSQSLYNPDSPYTPRIKGFTKKAAQISETITNVSLESGTQYVNIVTSTHLKLIAERGASLPSEIRITVKGVKLNDFTYDSATGEIVIYSGITSDAVISAVVPCEHNWDAGTVTVPATKAADGSVYYTCKLCGDTDIQLAPFLYGDVNNDLRLNGMDGNMMISYIIGDLSYIDMEKADIYEDNRVDAKDDILHRQLVAGDYVKLLVRN